MVIHLTERKETMTYGAIDFVALEFKGNQFKGEIMPALIDLIEKKIVRVIDLVIVIKDENGIASAAELQELDPQAIAIFDPLKAEITGMIKAEDVEKVGKLLDNNTTAAMMLFENLWSLRFKEAVLNANGRLVMMQRVPDEVVQEVMDDMALPE
jgi:hypothetical protein